MLSSVLRRNFSSVTAAFAGNYGWVGLGAMGKPMANHIHKLRHPANSLKVWNRTAARATEHAAAYGTTAVAELDHLSDCNVVFLSLPTTVQVADICERLNLPEGAIVIDTTSGDPGATQKIAAKLLDRGIHMVDCPVSGGPAGAEAGTVTTMLGG